jgi:hypothetical protein
MSTTLNESKDKTPAARAMNLISVVKHAEGASGLVRELLVSFYAHMLMEIVKSEI